MREGSIAAVIAAAVVFGTGISASASEKAPEAMVQTMRGINTSMMSLRTNVEAKNWAAAAKDGASLATLFKTTETFWKQRKTEDAVKFAETAHKAASDLEAGAKAKNEEKVVAAQRAMTAACTGCHGAHRERTPDGTYSIK